MPKLTAGPDPHPKKPKLKAPPGACDAHIHLFGPAAKYPFAPDSPYIAHDALPRNLHGLAGQARALHRRDRQPRRLRPQLLAARRRAGEISGALPRHRAVARRHAVVGDRPAHQARRARHAHDEPQARPARAELFEGDRRPRARARLAHPVLSARHRHRRIRRQAAGAAEPDRARSFRQHPGGGRHRSARGEGRAEDARHRQGLAQALRADALHAASRRPIRR